MAKAAMDAVLDFTAFSDRIRESLTGFYGEDASVELKPVIKNNGVRRDAVFIRAVNADISPVFYLDDFYNIYREEGGTVEEIAGRIIRLNETNRARDTFEPARFGRFGEVKDIIGFKLVNYERNRELLSEVPHRRILDLALVYICVMKGTAFGNASILVRDALAEQWGIDEEGLYGLALANMPFLLPVKEAELSQFLAEKGFMLPGDYSVPVTIETNDAGFFGAGVICYRDFLQKKAEELGDFVVIPSSIHEVLVMPCREDETAAELRDMVKEVNRSVVEEGEILSDNVYRYDFARKELEIFM